jgi:hypothetical protein
MNSQLIRYDFLMKNFILQLICSLILLNTKNTYNCEIIINGLNNYTSLSLGNLNILISAPHGGNFRPESIADRTEDDHGNLKGDKNTKEIAFILRDELSLLFLNNSSIDAKPFLLYNNLSRFQIVKQFLRRPFLKFYLSFLRVKMDPNRDDKDCCQNQIDDCKKAYDDYHEMIIKYFQNDFMMNTLPLYEQGLIIDLHGQGEITKINFG